MSFTSQRQKILVSNNQASTQTLKEYEKNALELSGYLSIKQYKDIALNFLYEDLIQAKTDYDFNVGLSKSYYLDSNNHALDCLVISLKSREIQPQDIRSWTKNALFCFNLLLIYYISEILDEKVSKHTRREKETDVYTHLISKGGGYYEIGIKFQSIYQYRSKFEHVQYTDENGKRQARHLSNKKLREAKELILKYFKESLIKLLDCYKTSSPVAFDE